MCRTRGAGACRALAVLLVVSLALPASGFGEFCLSMSSECLVVFVHLRGGEGLYSSFFSSSPGSVSVLLLWYTHSSGRVMLAPTELVNLFPPYLSCPFCIAHTSPPWSVGSARLGCPVLRPKGHWQTQAMLLPEQSSLAGWYGVDRLRGSIPVNIIWLVVAPFRR